MPDVAVLGQMRRSTGFTAAGHHLVERAAMRELGVEVPAEFTRPAGAGVEAIGDGCVDVFHEGLAPGGGENGLAWFVRQSHNTPPRLIQFNACFDAAFVLQAMGPDKSPAAAAIFQPSVEFKPQECGIPAVMRCDIRRGFLA